MDKPKCITCKDKGWIWGRTKFGEKGHMTKKVCKCQGRTKVIKGYGND